MHTSRWNGLATETGGSLLQSNSVEPRFYSLNLFTVKSRRNLLVLVSLTLHFRIGTFPSFHQRYVSLGGRGRLDYQSQKKQCSCDNIMQSNLSFLFTSEAREDEVYQLGLKKSNQCVRYIKGYNIYKDI